MESRTGKQCRERYFNHLQPNIKKGNWSDEEDQIIVNMQAKIGNQWSAMTKYLPGRTDNAIKNRWHAIVKAQTQHESPSQNPHIISSDNNNVNITEPNRKNANVFTFKPPTMHTQNNTATAFYGSAPGGMYMPHGSSTRNYTPFEPPSESDHDSSPFKPSQMPASHMNILPAGFENMMSRVADTTISAAEDMYGKGTNVSLDFLSYFFEKELDSKESDSLDTNGMLYLPEPNSAVTSSEASTGSNGMPNSNLNNQNQLRENNGFDGFDDNTGLVFDFSRVSLDFTLDDTGAANMNEFDIALPSPINYKNLTVSVPITNNEDYSYLTVPLSHRPRTPRSPVLVDLKRTRF